MFRFRQGWIGIVGDVLLLWQSARWLWGWAWEWRVTRQLLKMSEIGQAIDFAVEHWQHPGWIGVVLGNPIAQFSAIALGLAFIYWDQKQPSRRIFLSPRQMIVAGLTLVILGAVIAAIGVWRSETPTPTAAAPVPESASAPKSEATLAQAPVPVPVQPPAKSEAAPPLAAPILVNQRAGLVNGMPYEAVYNAQLARDVARLRIYLQEPNSAKRIKIGDFKDKGRGEALPPIPFISRALSITTLEAGYAGDNPPATPSLFSVMGRGEVKIIAVADDQPEQEFKMPLSSVPMKDGSTRFLVQDENDPFLKLK
jgi:hypothetical protein